MGGNDEDALEDMLSSIPQLLLDRKKKLDEDAKELAAQREQFEKEKKEMGLNYQPSDVLHLNVGGDTTLAVLRKTITSVDNSMLSSKFSGRWDDSQEKDEDGNFFIDQPIELFRPMIDYLRARQCETPLAPPVSSPDYSTFGEVTTYRDFIRMVEYYGMTPGIYPTKICLYSGREADSTITNHKVVASEYSAFTIELQGHSRKIVAFEVKLENTDAFQIGWTSKATWPKQNSAPNQVGLAEDTDSLGLDMARHSVRLNSDAPVEIEGNFSSAKGTTVRCEFKFEDDGHHCLPIWFVDGNQVDYESQHDQPRYDFNNSRFSKYPAFSGKGEWSVTSVELEKNEKK